jgi:hypothetical protein
VEAVCQGAVDASFVEEFSVVSALLGGLRCSDQPQRLIWLPALTTELAIGSTPGAARIADQLRDEISSLANTMNFRRS